MELVLEGHYTSQKQKEEVACLCAAAGVVVKVSNLAGVSWDASFEW